MEVLRNIYDMSLLATFIIMNNFVPKELTMTKAVILKLNKQGGLQNKFAYVKFGGGEVDKDGIGWVEVSVHGLFTCL